MDYGNIASAYRLDGQKILVAGAASGIGEATCHVCAGLGGHVVATDINPVDSVVATIRESGGQIFGHLLDMSDRRAVENLAREIGGVDGIVAAGAVSPFDDWMDSPDWDRNFDLQMNVNVRGPINLARAWLPGMLERGSGSIVVVGSLAGKTGGVHESVQLHYVASKGAVHACVRWLSRRAIGGGVNVNGIAPGPVRTNMNATLAFDLEKLPMKRLGRAEEIAWPIAFLCSPAASYISGVVLDVNGGTFVGG
jgi:NAD(P)-dependent dehydrogenase (short-subunit alcohol dehydrogenase family)